MRQLRLKLIACDVFARLAYHEAAKSAHIVDVQLLPMLAHIEPDALRADIQAAIDTACQGYKPRPNTAYDKILLGYGLCGNAAMGLSSTIPMIVPRMHDCCAMFMGSKQKFLDVFGHRLSTPWRSCGYMERCDSIDIVNYKSHPDYLKLVEEYGDDNAEYIWESMNPPEVSTEAVYIQLPGFEHNNAEQNYTKQKIQEDCQVETVQGDISWFTKLVNGPWDSSEFLELSPGGKIEPIYDMETVFKEG